MNETTDIITKKDQVSVLELQCLLYELKDLRPDICVRFRLIGQMWQTHHSRILKLTGNGVILNCETTNKLIFIDINNVMQFDLDKPFKQYLPHFHYSIQPFTTRTLQN